MTRFLRAAGLAVCLVLCLGYAACAYAEPLEKDPPMTLTSPSALLMEADNGTIIFEKNADEKRPVASVTKLMTLLIVLEKIDNGEITLQDSVQVSSYAAGQQGSQALLDANVIYPLEDLLRSAIIASANDSAVALAEYIAGSEESFAALMNERAMAMGLANSHYVNCTGLPAANQYTSARDVACIAREICRHPKYFEYASVWMDTLVHPSGRKTDLTNTNRLVRFYQDCDGMKTGSTNEAKYCLVASAQRKGMRLIAVVLGVPNSQTRFDEARAMMDYGFATYLRTQVAQKGDLTGKQVKVLMGSRDKVDIALGSGLSMLLKSGQAGKLSFEAVLPESVQAPVEKEQPIGEIDVLLDGKIIAKLPAVAAYEVRLPGMLEGFYRIAENWQ